MSPPPLHQSEWLDQRKEFSHIILASKGTTATHTTAKIISHMQNTITQHNSNTPCLTHMALKCMTELLQRISEPHSQFSQQKRTYATHCLVKKIDSRGTTIYLKKTQYKRCRLHFKYQENLSTHKIDSRETIITYKKPQNKRCAFTLNIGRYKSTTRKRWQNHNKKLHKHKPAQEKK